jgi:hypothetical protein
MAEQKHGYIKISRKQFDGDDLFWNDGTRFDSRSAWVWLLQAAAWRDGEYRVKMFAEPLMRGEFLASLRFLAKRWKWGKTHVAKFLAHLEKEGRICGQRKGQHGSVYLIVNYDAYQTANGTSGTPSGTPSRTLRGHLADKVEGSIRKDKETTNGYPAEFDILWNAYPKRPGSNKRNTYACYLSRLKDGCSYEAMFEGTKAYHAFCLRQGWLGTNSVKMPETFYGPARHFASDWSESAPAPRNDNPAERVWSGMKRTQVLFSLTAEDWQRRMEDMVKAGEAESIEWLQKLIRSVNRTELQNARNDHFAVEHIAQSMPPALRIA